MVLKERSVHAWRDWIKWGEAIRPFAFSSNNHDKCLFRPTSAENFSAEVEVGICVEKMACAFSSLTF